MARTPAAPAAAPRTAAVRRMDARLECWLLIRVRYPAAVRRMLPGAAYGDVAQPASSRRLRATCTGYVRRARDAGEEERSDEVTRGEPDSLHPSPTTAPGSHGPRCGPDRQYAVSPACRGADPAPHDPDRCSRRPDHPPGTPDAGLAER